MRCRPGSAPDELACSLPANGRRRFRLASSRINPSMLMDTGDSSGPGGYGDAQVPDYFGGIPAGPAGGSGQGQQNSSNNGPGNQDQQNSGQSQAENDASKDDKADEQNVVCILLRR